eukprot:98384-Pyramimonas_sp.AAC.1
MITSDGSAVTSMVSKAEESTNHFGDNEAAELMTQQEVIDICNNGFTHDASHIARSIDTFASIYELQGIRTSSLRLSPTELLAPT